jgi:hypothetical protein
MTCACVCVVTCHLLTLELLSGPNDMLVLSYGPSSRRIQFGTLLVRFMEFSRVILSRTSRRPVTLPNPRTSGRSRSNGSDCRPARGTVDVSEYFVVGRLGPGSPK